MDWPIESPPCVSLLDVTTPVGSGVRREQVPQDVLSTMFDLLTDLADHETVVMVWEDLHEADSDSIALLMRLARLLAHTRVLVIATTRPRWAPGIVGFERLVEQLEQEGRGVMIDLKPLAVPTSAPSLPIRSVRCPKANWST